MPAQPAENALRIARRDRALKRLENLTAVCAGGAVGLAAMLGMLAAGSFPGHQVRAPARQAGASGSAPASAGGTDNDGADGGEAAGDTGQGAGDQPVPVEQPQPPPGGFFGFGGGGPVAVSGGS